MFDRISLPSQRFLRAHQAHARSNAIHKYFHFDLLATSSAASDSLIYHISIAFVKSSGEEKREYLNRGYLFMKRL